MVRRDWLLLLVALGDGGALDPIRIQKGLFLLAQEAGLPTAQRYTFVPYNYGPMSSAVYRDVDVLVRRGLLERRSVESQRWLRVQATARGRARAVQLEARSEREATAALARLRSIRALVDRLDFAGLLATIYDRYPAYAARSVFRRP